MAISIRITWKDLQNGRQKDKQRDGERERKLGREGEKEGQWKRETNSCKGF